MIKVTDMLPVVYMSVILIIISHVNNNLSYFGTLSKSLFVFSLNEQLNVCY